jgi:N-acetylglucosamine kinase-like BadF-type ATPase
VSGAAVRVAGVDAGASHTRAIVTDAALHPLGRADGPAGAARPGAEDAAARTILRTVEDARQAAGMDREPLAGLVVGAAGTGDPAVRAALAAALEAPGTAARVAVCTDADVALAAAFPEGPGVLLIAGTGSIALAIDAAGGRHRVGGRGWRLGDEGSGYALGRAGAAAAVQALEGRGPPTALARLVPAALGLGAADDLLAWVSGAEPGAVAALGRVVQEAADAGDAVALGLVEVAADDLVAHVVALRPHFGVAAGVPVVLSGGAVAPGRPLRRRVMTLMGARARWASVRDVAVDAALGAARLAIELVGRRPDG